MKYFGILLYQNPLLLAKDLLRAKQPKNKQLVNNTNDELIAFKNTIIKKEIPENENQNKIVDIVEKILDFNKQQQGKGHPRTLASQPLDLAHVANVFHHTCIKILTHKQMLQRLTIALAQAKASSTSENILNEIYQIIYSVYQEKEITKKVYNNIMNSIKL